MTVVTTVESVPEKEEEVTGGGARVRDAVMRRAPEALLLVALALWLVAVPLLRGVRMGQYGLLASPGGAVLAVACGFAVTGFVVAVAVKRTWIAAAAVLAVIVIQRATVPLITEVPIYTWTYKHIGLVDYLLANHRLAPASVDIYNQWPGFFAAVSWFSAVSGADPVTVAHWFGPMTHVLGAVLIAMLALGLRLGMRAALCAALLAELLNWVGQDYYAPQSLGYVMALACLALLAYSKTQPAAGYMSLVVFAALVPTHQLTPVWLCALALALAVFRQIKPFWLPLAYGALVLAYVLPREQFVKRYGLFTGSNPLKNSSSNVASRGSDGRMFTMLVDRSLSVSMWILAALCFVVLWRRVGAPWAAGIMAFSSMMLLAGQSYGGEAIFRVFLYSVAGCCMLVAPFLAKGLSIGTGVRRIAAGVTVWLLLVVVMLAGMQGYYGGWSYVTMTRTQLEQSRWLLKQNPEGATITVMVPAGWPERPSAEYVQHALANPDYDSPLVFLKDSLSQGFPLPQDLDRLELLARSGGNQLYLVLTRQTGAYSDYFRMFRDGAVPSLVAQLDKRPHWKRVISDDDSVVFTYVEGGGAS